MYMNHKKTFTCQAVTINGYDLENRYPTKSYHSDRSRYYTQTQSDYSHYNQTQSDAYYYSKTHCDTAGALGGTMGVELCKCMKLSGGQTLMGDITFASGRDAFAGATPT